MIPDSFYGPAFSNERTIVLLVAGADPEIFSGGWLQHYTTVYWRGIKFGGLAVLGETAKLKSAKLFGGDPPNLMIANISGYTVCDFLSDVHFSNLVSARLQGMSNL